MLACAEEKRETHRAVDSCKEVDELMLEWKELNKDHNEVVGIRHVEEAQKIADIFVNQQRKGRKNAPKRRGS